jgi:hypothetical protein
VIGALPPVNLLTSLNSALQSGRDQNSMRSEQMRLENAAAVRRAQLEQAQLPAQEALARAQVQQSTALDEKIGAATDPRLKESLIRGEATGTFQPFEIEPTAIEIATTQMVFGITRDQAAEALRSDNSLKLAKTQAGYSAEQARITAGLQRETNRLDNEGRRAVALAGKAPGIDDERSMRAEFEGLSKEFGTVRTAYKTIKSLPDTKVGDLTLLIQYMKLTDPGSTVREGELATADNAGGVPAYLRSQYNRLRSDAGRLDPDVRQDYLARTDDIYQARLSGHRGLAKQYGEIATRRGIDPRNVITDFVGEEPAAPPTADEIRAELARRANAGR